MATRAPGGRRPAPWSRVSVPDPHRHYPKALGGSAACGMQRKGSRQHGTGTGTSCLSYLLHLACHTCCILLAIHVSPHTSINCLCCTPHYSHPLAYAHIGMHVPLSFLHPFIHGERQGPALAVEQERATRTGASPSTPWPVTEGLNALRSVMCCVALPTPIGKVVSHPPPVRSHDTTVRRQAQA